MLLWFTSAVHVVQAAQYLKQTGHVNTYTFTKMLTEMAIAEFHNSSFTVAIVRPSIVVSSSVSNLPATCFCFRRGAHQCVNVLSNSCKVCMQQLCCWSQQHAKRTLQRQSCISSVPVTASKGCLQDSDQIFKIGTFRGSIAIGALSLPPGDGLLRMLLDLCDAGCRAP